MNHHGHTSRSFDTVPLGTTPRRGRFGRMFPYLPPLQIPPAAVDGLVGALRPLADGMTEAPGAPNRDNADIPAGFTYLGQFIDHDITFDPTPMPEQSVDPLSLWNFRTPKLDLDSVYGTGPDDQPYLYERDGRHLRIGSTTPLPIAPFNLPTSFPNDLPRAPNGLAVIGDPRNDENVILAQLHLAFLKFHNKVVDLGHDFVTARRIVTWHYQYIVLNEFLKKVAMPEWVDAVREQGRRFYLPEEDAYMPVEFAAAAYRFGHSMVRDGYEFNRFFGFGPGKVGPSSFFGALNFTEANLFFFTGKTGNSAINGVPPGFPSLPSNWIIDWRNFFNMPASPVAPQPSRKIDAFLARGMSNIPGAPHPLQMLNLLRSVRVGLPSGQDIAKAMKMRHVMLTPAEIAPGIGGVTASLRENTPLWYYLLTEAGVRRGGKSLGPVGSRLLAEVFVGLLQADSRSFLTIDPGWTPAFSVPALRHVDTIGELIAFAGNVNPLGP